MIELVGCLPPLHTYITKDLKWIKDQLSSAKEEVREYTALLYGIVLSVSTTGTEFDTAVKTLLNEASSKNYETQHGAILAIGSCLELKALHQKSDEDCMELVKASVETLGNSFIF